MLDHRRELRFYGICTRIEGELDHTVAKRFSDVGDPAFDPYRSRALGNGKSGRCPIPAPIVTRYRMFLRQIGCLADRYLGVTRRNRSRRAKCRYPSTPCHLDRTRWLVSSGVRAVPEMRPNIS